MKSFMAPISVFLAGGTGNKCSSQNQKSKGGKGEKGRKKLKKQEKLGKKREKLEKEEKVGKRGKSWKKREKTFLPHPEVGFESRLRTHPLIYKYVPYGHSMDIMDNRLLRSQQSERFNACSKYNYRYAAAKCLQ